MTTLNPFVAGCVEEGFKQEATIVSNYLNLLIVDVLTHDRLLMAKLTSSTRETEDSPKQLQTTVMDAEHWTLKYSPSTQSVSMVCTCIVLVLPSLSLTVLRIVVAADRYRVRRKCQLPFT